MYSVISSVVLLHICFALDTTIASDNGYIVYELSNIPCKEPSNVIPTCSISLDYEIPDFSKVPKPPESPEFRNAIPSIVKFLASYGEECREAGAKYFCHLAYPFRCKEALVGTEVKRIEASCNEGRKECSSLKAIDRKKLFECSSLAYNPFLRATFLRKQACKVFPILKNDSYSCDASYKVFSLNAKDLNNTVNKIAFFHAMLKSSNMSDVECEKNVADVVCNASILACSKDETKVVSILSKQDCRKIVGCVNKTNDTNLIKTVNGLCDVLPDGTTAKKYPLDNDYDNKTVDNDYDNKAVGHAMTFSTILSIATLVGSSFF